MTTAVRDILAARLAVVEARIRAACQRVGRPRDDVTLVAVTKYTPPSVVALLPDLGLLDLGESRPQDLWRKAAALPSEVRWHMIGHLQRNKVERTLPLTHLIHSADSPRLLESLDREAGKLGRRVEVLLEVNLTQEPNKHGLTREEALALFPQVAESFPQVSVRGLMTMAALSDDPETSRPTFAELRRMRDRLRADGHDVRHLSMGMTNDFETAIEEGATLIRVGSALFEGLGESQP